MVIIFALAVAIAALAIFLWLARGRLLQKRGGHGRGRYFSVDLAERPVPDPLDP